MDVVEHIDHLRRLLDSNRSANDLTYKEKIIRDGEISHLILEIENNIFIKSDPEIFQVYRSGVSTLSAVKSESGARRLLLGILSTGLFSNGPVGESWRSASKGHEISSDTLLSAVSILFEAHDTRERDRRPALSKF